MTQSADYSLVRRTNQRLILDILFKLGPLSRAQLSRRLNLSKPAVSNNLKGLFSVGLLEETSLTIGKPKRGCVPVLIGFVPDSYYVATIDLNYQDPVFAICTIGGTVVDSMSIHVSAQVTDEALCSMMVSALNILLQAHNIPIEKLYRIGISAPGRFETKALYPIFTKRVLSVFQKDSVAKIAATYGVPVFVKNDAQMSLLGEMSNGVCRGEKNVLYFCCGMGFGSAIVIDGKLYEGALFGAGALGNFSDRQRMVNGKTIEDEICIPAMLQKIQRAIEAGEPSCLQETTHYPLLFDEVVAAYGQNDALTVSVVEECVLEVACVVRNLVLFLDIQYIVFGGEYLAFGSLFPNAIKSMLDEAGIPTTVTQTALGKFSGISGLVSIAREELFEEACGNERADDVADCR